VERDVKGIDSEDTIDLQDAISKLNRSDEVRLVHQENRGLLASTNRGLSMARGQYIARMDGDDINHSERFDRQVCFLEDTPEVGVLGVQADKIDAEGKLKGEWKRSLPTDPEVAAWRLLFNVCFCHPTVMMRRSLLEDLGGYAEGPPGLDYELFARAVLETRMTNLPDTLFRHRRHEGSVSVNRREEYTRRCAEAADRLHCAILRSTGDSQIARFLVWMEREGVENAN
jgi:glycosyltransferase involved in cell wall biosynthesis